MSYDLPEICSKLKTDLIFAVSICFRVGARAGETALARHAIRRRPLVFRSEESASIAAARLRREFPFHIYGVATIDRRATQSFDHKKR